MQIKLTSDLDQLFPNEQQLKDMVAKDIQAKVEQTPALKMRAIVQGYYLRKFGVVPDQLKSDVKM